MAMRSPAAKLTVCVVSVQDTAVVPVIVQVTAVAAEAAGGVRFLTVKTQDAPAPGAPWMKTEKFERVPATGMMFWTETSVVPSSAENIPI